MTEMMRDDAADINSVNLLMRWTLIWIPAPASVKAKGVCPCAFIAGISEVICQQDSSILGNLPSSPPHTDWLLIPVQTASGWATVASECQASHPASSPSQRPNPINEWEWVSSSADVNLSLRHLSHIVYWWGPRNGRGPSPKASHNKHDQGTQ